MEEPLIRAIGVNMVYGTRGNRVEALCDIDLDVKPHTFVTILGPSGCGKSTLLKIIGGLLRPTSGQVTIGGKPVAEALKSKPFGFVFQEAALLPWRDVLHNATLLLEMNGHGQSANEARAKSLLEMVGLGGFLRHYPGELSGGMRQRVAIARALSIDPQILLMDEPFGALDAITRDKMNLELLRIWSETKKTAVLVTHSIMESVFLSDEVFVMSSRPGRIIERAVIDLPRPRDMGIQKTARFLEYVDHLRLLLDRGSSDAACG